MKLWGFLLVLLAAGCAHFVRDVLPRSQGLKLEGVWVGRDSTGMYLYALLLRDEGNGFLGSLYDGRELRTNRITQWAASGDALSLSLDEAESPRHPVSVRGTIVTPSYITLRIRGKEWQQDVTLLPLERVDREVRIITQSLPKP